MDDATEDLKKDDTRQATQSQDKAIDELEQAKKELEDALNQLRKEEREETLRDLESRFREMLTKQRGINDATLRVDELGQESFKRAQQLQLAELSAKERLLAQDAAGCLHILDEDGTTIVFPRVVGQLSSDMATVADRLAALKSGTLTQAIEKEILDTLEQLLEAVQKMQQDSEQEDSEQQQQQSQDGDEAPLLPPSAELKLLRASQVRINTRTGVIEEARGEGTESKKDALQALKAVAQWQVETAKTAEEMRERTDAP